MKRLLQMIKERKIKKSDVIMAAILLSGLYFLNMNLYKTDSLPGRQVDIVNAYMVKQDGFGNDYIIDKEHTRIIKTDADHNVLFSITGNSREKDSITYTSDMAVAGNGDIFVEENHWGGLYVDREAVLVYDSRGRYKATCYEDIYDDEYVDKRKLYGLVTDEENLYYAVLHKDEICIWKMNLETYIHSPVKYISYQNAYNAVYEVCIDTEDLSVYVLDKRGRVAEITGSADRILYDMGSDSRFAGNAAFYDMAVDVHKNIYLTDIKGNRLFRLGQGNKILSVIAEGDSVLSVNTSAAPDGQTVLCTVFNGMLYEMDTSGNTLFAAGALVKSREFIRLEILLLLAAGICLLSAVWLALRMAAVLAGVRLTQIMKNGLLISATVTLVVLIVVGQLMGSFQSIYTNELFEKLFISAHAVSSQIDRNAVKQVNKTEDFMSKEYNILLDSLNSILDRSYEFNQNIYCNILKYEGGKGYSIAYLDQSAGTYYPLDDIETGEVKQVYETKEEVQNGGKADVAGSFAYVKVPVLDYNGDVIAVVAVGSDTSIIGSQIAAMQQKVLITLITIILIILFLFGEILGFFDLKSKYKIACRKNPKAVPLHMMRVVIFITFAAFNMATSFLPVYAARMAGEGLNIPGELAASLPITLNLAFMGIMSVFCARLLERFRFKTIAAASAVIALAGDIIIFLGGSYYAVITGLIFNGIGVGLITNSINMFIASSADKDLKRDGFAIFNSTSVSGINIGSMLGASLAGMLGQQNVFCISALTWGLVAALYIVLGKYIGKMQHNVQPPKSETKQGFRRFITDRRVIGYLICIQIPYIILNSFIYYYVPLYCSAKGFSESVTCLLLMVNSLCSVFFGVALTNFFEKRFKERAVYISTIMSLAALVLFAVNMSAGMLVAVLLIMGVSSSFGMSVKSVYFTELDAVRRYGEEEAMGVYNLTDNIGESAGPMIFGALMSSGNILVSMGRFVTVIVGAQVFYAIGSHKKKKHTESIG